MNVCIKNRKKSRVCLRAECFILLAWLCVSGLCSYATHPTNTSNIVIMEQTMNERITKRKNERLRFVCVQATNQPKITTELTQCSTTQAHRWREKIRTCSCRTITCGVVHCTHSYMCQAEWKCEKNNQRTASKNQHDPFPCVCEQSLNSLKY